MAGETGSARQEAERLVATVLAMASQSGAARDDDSISGTSARIVKGLGTLGDTLAGMVGHLAGGLGGQRAADELGRERRADQAPSGQPARAEGDVWGAATIDGPGTRPRDRDAGAGDAPGTRPRDWDAGPRGGTVRYGLATGSAECCVCPICRTIAGMRDPTPESAARLASGAGDFASGVASLMRAFSAMSGSRPRPAKRSRPAAPPVDPDVAWSAATRRAERQEPVDLTPDHDESPWAAATRKAIREAEAEAALRKASEAEAALQKASEAEAAQRTASEAEAALREASEAAAEAALRKPASSPRTRNGSGSEGTDRDRRQEPAPHAGRPDDVWAAATAAGVDRGEAGVTGGSAVDDDART